ncbi:hypothetical protein JR316_0006797 [Psilocybe cubensis]|uniref:Uncharacterized protein n=1 Tax=Psilocybe cubensis TaxID=181762 RepID=A0ACB8GYW1_PSICU|nr:hypothetical protein JR316_0006797 [Psilocybe cubensis]KAH9480199.1 hypothetical protein JR316_0006797 [Psilocybe cubensis]
MNKVTNNSGAPSNPTPLPSTYFASPIRTLKESLKEPGTHDVSTHDLVEAYNSLATKLRDRFDEISVTPSVLTVIQNEAEVLSDCLVRDIGRVLPNPFASQHYNHSLGNISVYTEQEADDDDELEFTTDNNLLCQYALRFVSDIFTFPNMHCNFTDNQLVLIFDYVLRICKSPSSTIYNLEKHSAMVVWILKVQQLPLSVLLPLQGEIMLALENSISHDLGGYIAKLDAFKAVRSILKKHPTCSSWLVGLLPKILTHIDSDSPEIAIHAALACTGFTNAKMEMADVDIDAFPTDLVSKHVEVYVIDRMSRRTPSGKSSALVDFFRSAAYNKPQWRHLGLPFTLTVVSCFIALLGHRIFLSSQCIRFAVLVLRECAGALPSAQKEAWGLLFWAYSRLPRELERDAQRNRECTKERAFRVVKQDGRQSNLIVLLLRAGEVDFEARRSDEDISRALVLLLDLVGSDSEENRKEGTAILSRILDFIGSPSTMFTPRVELPFPRELIDDSILFQAGSKLKITPYHVPIEHIPPLTETEVLCHWERLVEIWISVAQHALDSGQQLPDEVTGTWQALLLVRGEIVTGEDLLVGPPALSSTLTSIVNRFNPALDSIATQIDYLSFIRKLWSVMKNVFAKSFLSSAGESILVSLLKRSFDLMDSRVKSPWRQVCGDLISIGVPTFLRGFNLRESESQEEAEVMHQLWTVLAQNGLLEREVQNWETLVDFLVMPLGVWYLSDSELLYWQTILARAIEIGGTQEDVMKRFVSLCSEDKTNDLKQSTRLLHSLLTQLSRSSEPCSPTNLQILSWIDEMLCDSYNSLESSESAIGILRLIGEVISNTAESNIVQLLATLKNSLSMWIADAHRKLKGNEDDEMVDALYQRPLHILSNVEPSIAILESLTDFFMSVFVRIRGQGPLAFYNFWQATYHKRDSIPKDQIPMCIRQKLKSWADVTDGSIGDGIPFDSGSESIQSYVDPDSQPRGVEELDLMDQGHPPDEKTGMMITAHDDYPQRSDDDNENTPVPRSRFTELKVVGDVDDHSRSQQKAKVVESASVKRSAESDASGSRTPKRRKLASPALSDEIPRINKGKGKAKEISRLPSPSFFSPSRALSDDGDFDIPRGSDDYDLWERNVALEEVEEIRAQFQQGSSADIHCSYQSEDDGGSAVDSEDILGPSLNRYDTRSKARERSQTAPELSNPTQPAPNSLRRNNTTPAEETIRKPSKIRDQVGVLQKAYAVVAHAGPSQINVDDIIEAKRVLNDLHEALDEQLNLVLASGDGRNV